MDYFWNFSSYGSYDWHIFAISADTVAVKILVLILCVVAIIGVYLGLTWYFNNTASGQRKMIDQKSNLNGGIERIINVYTANGDVIATYTGKIDIEAADGGYVKFDLDGKRYIYYNCFIETIAELGE